VKKTKVEKASYYVDAKNNQNMGEFDNYEETYEAVNINSLGSDYQ